ncbi:S-layer homology domain-containing protein [Prochlorothrix hollandica]|uniref:SLH domain-containing protein n=1 Tax=Prochlorothrix hollandica PCC 9006 = CALU 1027 TaxID=317619 RepID=A0A0M2Q102_PROHO|nr:S-layer homology domain-containing protein [Prochlorothrix hollandica]KKJ00639.1 hypothetical protein PROH_04860 [Prochlorothrix hollandica PCC 9006 = CALU 1027]
MAAPSPTPTLYVNPLTGRDTAVGTATQPLRTLSQALGQAQAGHLIQLMPGYYTAGQGEQFPLVIPEGVTVLGRQEDQGAEVYIEGGAAYSSPGAGNLVLALHLESRAELRGVTVVNPEKQGTGIWVNGGGAAIVACRVQQCGREGLLVTQGGIVWVSQTQFVGNQTSGITFLHQSKGEVRDSQFQAMRLGLAIGGESSPLLVNNVVTGNGTGVAIVGNASPVLRGNRITDNKDDGLVVKEQATPDLGQPQDPGHNILRGNPGSDLRQTLSDPLVSVGNWLNPTRVTGSVQFLVSQVPPPPSPLDPASPTAPPAPPEPSPLPSPPPLKSVPFGDLAGHWAAAFVVALSDRGLVSGFPDGSFRPDRTLTRAEYAALLAKVFDLPLGRSAPAYQDLSASFWARDAIIESSRMGFLRGFPDGSFRPQQFLTRIQTIVSLVSGLGLTGGNPSLLEVYDDRAQIPSYGIAAVTAASQHRLIINYPQPQQVNPLRPATRAETMAMVYQALVTLGKIPALASPYVVAHGGSSQGFPDVQSHWAAPFIAPLADRNLVQGLPDGTFQPDRLVNRAEYAALLARAFQPSPKKTMPHLTDIPPDFWAREAIITAIRGGFLAGSKNLRFQPHQPVLRFQVLQSLASGLGLKAGSPALLQQFLDWAELPPQAQKAVAAALANSLIVVPEPLQRLQPHQPATRGEVAAMIHQGLVYQGRLLPVRSAAIVPR